MFSSIGNWCISCNTGEKCSCIRVGERILAATFWTCWSILLVCFGCPYGSEIQKSNLEVMKACTSISVVWRLIYFFMRLMFRGCKKVDKRPALHTADCNKIFDRHECITQNTNVSTILVTNRWNRNRFPWILSSISYIHSSHIRSHSKVPISFPSVEQRLFWSTETTVIPKLTLGKGKRTQVFQDLWRVLWLPMSC